MNDYVFEQIFGLLNEFRIQADVPRPVVATAPLGLRQVKAEWSARKTGTKSMSAIEPNRSLIQKN